MRAVVYRGVNDLRLETVPVPRIKADELLVKVAAGGGYAEYVRVMSFVLPGVVKIPGRNSFLEGAMLEPVNTVLKAIHRLALLRGDFVLVTGQGPIGLMFTRLLALRGMNVAATDLLPARLELAKKFGARWIFGAHEDAGDPSISQPPLSRPAATL